MMQLSLLLGALSALSCAVAQQHVILVGSTSDAPGGIFQFIPPSINATNGTTITFRFTGAPGNHSITQSTFTDPCNPLPNGFDSGWVFIPPNNVSTSPEWNLTVTNDQTRKCYSPSAQLVPLVHCAAGMVGAINAPGAGNRSFEAFQTNAHAFKGNSGQGEGALAGQGASASAPPGPIVSGASVYSAAPVSASGSSPPSPTASGGSGGTSGAVIHAVDYALLFAAVALGVAFA